MNGDNKSEFYANVFWTALATILILVFGYAFGYYAGEGSGGAACYKSMVAK